MEEIKQEGEFPKEEKPNSDVTEDSKMSTQISDSIPQIRSIDIKKEKRAGIEHQTLSVKVQSKPNPFKFFEDPDGYEEEKKKANPGIAAFETNASLLPLNIGDRLDVSDLNKAKYMNPTKRRKMSYSDFENRVEDSNFTLLDLLVMCKADLTIREYLENQMSHVFEITKTFEDGRGFLYYAIKRGFTEVVKEMLSLSTEILHRDDKWGRLPIHYACMGGKFEIVKILVDNGSPIDTQDKEGYSPLHFAMLSQSQSISIFLISQGAKKNDPNQYGINPIDYLPQSQALAFYSIGLEHGESGCLRGPHGVNSDSMYRRRFELYRRKKVIKTFIDKTTFKDCYTERDKGKTFKQIKDNVIKLEVAPNEEVPEVREERTSDFENQEHTTIKKHPPNEYPGLESPIYPHSAPLDEHYSFHGSINSPITPLTPHDRRNNTSIALLENQGSNKVTHKDFTLIDVIGSGSFGEVYLVSSKKDNRNYAMKVYSKGKIIRSGLLKFLFLEKKILINFDHPFIVKVYATFQTPRKLYLVMDYCRFKDLGQYLTKNEKLAEHQARLLIAEVILAVEELHRRNIIHRDLKPDNILIGEDGHIKITDFGLSKDNVSKGKLTSTFCGSIAYLPPEVVRRVGHGQSADWYLVGELLYECLFGVPPFFNTSKKVLLASILSDDITFPSYINRCTKDLILRLTDKDPSKRLGCNGDARAIKAHPFFTGIDWESVYLKQNKLFDTKDIVPYMPLHYNQDIIDNAEPKGGSNKVLNWSVYR